MEPSASAWHSTPAPRRLTKETVSISGYPRNIFPAYSWMSVSFHLWIIMDSYFHKHTIAFEFKAAAHKKQTHRSVSCASC